MRRLFVGALMLALSILCVPGQAATVRHRIDHSRNAVAFWNDTDTGTMAVAHILPDENSQSLGLWKEYRDADGNVVGRTLLSVEQLEITPYGTFTMNKKLLSATLDVTGVPAHCSTLGRAPACSTTPTIDAHLTWTGVGRRMHSTDTRHCVVQFAGFVLIENGVSSRRSRRAVAAGRMNTTFLSRDDIDHGDLEFGLFGQVSVDVRNQGQSPNLVHGDCEL